jgi:hypothetical protein
VRKRWTAAEQRVIRQLHTPTDIQRYLDGLAYDARGGAASPRAVMRSGTAQCYSGALFAAAALRELGLGARIMWIDAVSDDGHCLALYEIDGLWGSVAKSNFTTLRSREPVYTYESLGLGYFDGYYNVLGKRTMRAFTVPIDLEPFESRGWRFDEGEMLYVDEAIDSAARAWTLPRNRVKLISNVSDQLREAGLSGSNAEGLWKP